MHSDRPVKILRVFVGLLLVTLSGSGLAWGPEAHRVVGLLAQLQLEPEAAAVLAELNASEDPDVIARACNWPDDYRATPDGAWSAPYHYINVPRHETGYLAGRDCRNDACVAEAIKRYAGELGNPDLEPQQRWQAWARVCHFVGDIHQPLHVGYVYDRGGNDTMVVFRGAEMDLHDFWDHALVESHYPEWRQLVDDLAVELEDPVSGEWTPNQADEWARESHRLVRQVGYPPSPEISPEFAAASWLLARERMRDAGRRLAWILNTMLISAD